MRTKVALVLGFAAAAVFAATAATAPGAITGSAHDFSGQAWNTNGQICQPCHTPHNASLTYKPLWNHAVTGSTFTIYSNSPSFNGATTIGQPDGVSKLCLSCHDGTVAVDSFGGATGSHFISGGDMLGTNLSNDHPISFTYDTALVSADSGGLKDPTTTGLPLYAGKLECATCHDVHNNGTAGAGDMLRFTNSGSALCLRCHNK